MTEIAEKVQAIIADKLGVELSQVTPAAKFTSDLGADSIDTVELLMKLEEEFGVKIPEEEQEKITTVQEAISYIENALSNK